MHVAVCLSHTCTAVVLWLCAAIVTTMLACASTLAFATFESLGVTLCTISKPLSDMETATKSMEVVNVAVAAGPSV